MIELNNITMNFAGAEVLGGIDLRIAEGEFVAIVGFSGSGKTTLVNLIAGLLRPTTGKVIFRDEEVTGTSAQRAVVFQNYSLLPWLTVHGNIALAVNQIFARESKDEREDRIEHYIQMVGLSHARDKRPAALSGGMRQRVALARGLSMDPDVLLLDEPLGALDALTRANLQDEISRIWQEERKTVLMITNDVDEALLLADRVIPLSPGPAAKLGPEVVVNFARPRDRKEINHDPGYRKMRVSILDYLTNSRPSERVKLTKKLHLPDIEPEDISHLQFFEKLLPGRGPRRRNELKTESVEVAS